MGWFGLIFGAIVCFNRLLGSFVHFCVATRAAAASETGRRDGGYSYVLILDHGWLFRGYGKPKWLIEGKLDFSSSGDSPTRSCGTVKRTDENGG